MSDNPESLSFDFFMMTVREIREFLSEFLDTKKKYYDRTLRQGAKKFSLESHSKVFQKK